MFKKYYKIPEKKKFHGTVEKNKYNIILGQFHKKLSFRGVNKIIDIF